MYCKKAFFYKILFENSVPLSKHFERIWMQPGCVTFDKMAGIFTKRIWQPGAEMHQRILATYTALGFWRGVQQANTSLFLIHSCLLARS